MLYAVLRHAAWKLSWSTKPEFASDSGIMARHELADVWG
jgi:hypothetical protein